MSDVEIKVRPNGPYLVSGSFKITDANGAIFSTEGKEVVALCRCGASANKPFCDGGHKGCSFTDPAIVPA
jgi:CDGSH-type Zn-finger protein